MASYLRAWWFGPAATNENNGTNGTNFSDTSTKTAETSLPQPLTLSAPIPPAGPPASVTISTPDETQEAIEEAMGVDEDVPPAFPSLNSVQRLSASRAKATRSDAALMPPPALPTTPTPLRDPSISSALCFTSNSISNAPPVLASSTSNTLKIPGVSGSSSNTLQLPPSTTRPSSSKRRGKVALSPGHSPLDWAALKVSGQDLRGVPTLMRVTPSQLKSHNKRDDAWSSFNGKVYNITPYLSFHPGGEKELMRVAGRDGTKLFALTHAWVNVEFMLDECMVGFLVPEPSSAA